MHRRWSMGACWEGHYCLEQRKLRLTATLIGSSSMQVHRWSPLKTAFLRNFASFILNPCLPRGPRGSTRPPRPLWLRALPSSAGEFQAGVHPSLISSRLCCSSSPGVIVHFSPSVFILPFPVIANLLHLSLRPRVKGCRISTSV